MAQITPSGDAHPASGSEGKADILSSPEAGLTNNAKVIELLPQADVTILAGRKDSAIIIKVSSHVLCIASKVFSRMLNSEFIEGTTKEINLTSSEDDAQAILDFCYIIHHQHESVKDVTSDRLKQLIILADMRDCKDALKPWLLSELADHLSWFNGNSSYAVPGSCMPTTLPGFGFEDFITFAAAFGLDDLFFKAAVADFARGVGLSRPGNCAKLAGASVPLVSHGTCIHDYLHETRLKIVRDLLERAMCATNVNFGTTKWGKKFTTTTFCKSSQEKYGTFMSRFAVSGINAGQSLYYFGSWWKAMKAIQDIANGTANGTDPDTGLQEEKWTKMCRVECAYCTSSIKERLKNLVGRKELELPGVCLKCFWANGKDDCLRKDYCTEPGHSNQGRRFHFKAV